MEILIARHAGFCFGVERAIDIVKSAVDSGEKVATFGPIIHNPQVVAELEEKGVKAIKDMDKIDKDLSIIVRSHGIEKETSLALREKSGRVIDATCPFVQKAQNAAHSLSEECDTVVLLGEAEHPEVKGIISYITGDYIVVENSSDVANLPFKKTYGLLAQTTQNNNVFNEVKDILSSKCDELKVAKTICSATDRRQEAALDVAKEVEIMVVIGGKNSANTTRLYRLCKEICPNTFHIETEDELDPSIFSKVSKVGITAGASTPVELITKVREYILEVGK